MPIQLTVRTIVSSAMAIAVVAVAAAAPRDAAPRDAASTDTPQVEVAAWQPPTAESVEAQILDWLIQSAPTDQVAAQRENQARPALDRLYTDDDRLTAMIDALAVASPAVAEMAEACHHAPGNVGSLEWLDSADIPYWMRNNVRLYVGRALVRHQYYEQALTVMEGLTVPVVFDPASLLFYRSIAEHQLVRIDEANASLDALLGANQPLPERYAQVARLMQADIADVKNDSLDHIARRMWDVQRRLDLGEADQRAQEVERGILASLDKMIDKLEEQQRQQQQQQQQQQAGGQPAGQPMDESRLAEMKGDGKVDIKDIGDQAGWGDLPPRERERVLQQIGRDFPGHYRDLMEEYLKRLATDEREPEQP